MLCGFDDDLAGQDTQVSNRIRGRLTQTHPALEHVFGPRLAHPAILDLLQRYPPSAAMRAAGEKRLWNRLLKNAPARAMMSETCSLTLVVPQVKEQLQDANFDVEIYLVDLQWGINTRKHSRPEHRHFKLGDMSSEVPQSGGIR